MNETIGVKGGANDRRRQMNISKKQKVKLMDYEQKRRIAELEKDVKKKQIYTLIKTLPIVIGGGVVKTIHDVAAGKKDNKEEENSKWRIKEYDQDVTHLTQDEFEDKERRKKIIVLPTGEKVVVYISPVLEKENIKKQDVNKKIVEAKEDIKIDKTPTKVDNFIKIDNNVSHKEEIKKKDKDRNIKEKKIINKEKTGVEEVDVEEFIDNELSNVDISNLSLEAKETLNKLKSRKIVEEYEKQLKDIRYELRKVIYEYNVLVDEDEKVVLSKDADIILDKLTDIIKKVEELKRKIRIDNLDKYDDNYIYYLIEGYIKEFHDKKVISEIKDSPLYVLIEEKLDELDKKRGKLEKSVEDKKEKLEEKEENFERLKKNYYSIDQLNNQLLEFQYDQNRLLKEIQEKVRNSVSETERVQVEFEGLNRQSKRLLNFLAFSMFLPGPKFARGIAAHTAAYLYFMNNVIKPHTKTRKYKVITVQDYHNDIVDSIRQIDDAIRLLGKTGDQIDKIMLEIQEKYRDYMDVVPECREILRNLGKIKNEIEEKEDEMKRIKKAQELELEKNDAKVKTMGEYPVN